MKPPGAFSRFEQALRREAEDVEMIERGPGAIEVVDTPRRGPGRPPKTERPGKVATQIALPEALDGQLQVVAEALGVSRANLLRMLSAAALEAVVDYLDMNSGTIRFPLSLRLTSPPIRDYNPVRRLSGDQFEKLKGFRRKF